MDGDAGATARVVVLVEGESDRRAVAALARRIEVDLAAEGVALVPMHGVTNLRRHLAELAVRREPPRTLGLFDANEAPVVARMLTAAGRADAAADLERAGFFACTMDLEDELIRAAGPDAIEEVLAAHGDLGRFRSFQQQPYQRGRPIQAQLRRFAGTAAGRKTWFAADVVEVLPPERFPSPMTNLLAAAVASE